MTSKLETEIGTHSIDEIDKLHGSNLVAEASDEFTDSEYGDSLASSTTSLKSDIRKYQFENGRRYHRLDNTNLLPNDETEQDRLDLHHYLFRILLGNKTHLAPLKNPQRILDVATGTGIWALEVAEEYPSAEVIGTDLTPIQPTWVVPNCKFEIDDAEMDWTWPDNHFDFIHSRNVAQSIKDWGRYMSQIYRTTTPGGWIELVEVHTDMFSDDGSLVEDSPIKQLAASWHPASKKLGIKVNSGEDYVELCERAGFVDIKLRKLKQPWNVWPKEPPLKHAGRVMQLVLETGVVAYNMAMLTRILEMPVDKAEKLCNDAYEQSKNRKVHAYNFIWVVQARKPTADEV